MTFSWTQPLCNDCWDKQNPRRKSPRMDVGEQEICCSCGEVTHSGIYTRVDPSTVDHPTLTR